ncbi:helix-turn-helix transcriptional regulator [Streptococcus mitis]|uniref:Transcriptional regulator n=1 Tax=Streptococcus mitis TaxID=28037 RepID=A0A1X1L0W7_STRMT|nr:helix-turn-helix transcriptional regulator [Streptococcus mitis]MCY7159063.1 helix-turn-helix transcriptional regulator [Streptococcus mitis]ORP05341.1 transcriptional regulator [Streptococcus mitis]
MQKMTLKTLRTLKNWRQADAAEAIDVSVDTWGNWERGKTEPTVTQAYQIATTFGVSIDDIIFYTTLRFNRNRKGTL